MKRFQRAIVDCSGETARVTYEKHRIGDLVLANSTSKDDHTCLLRLY